MQKLWQFKAWPDRNKSLFSAVLMVFSLCFADYVSAQAMSVLGGNQKARDCYFHAQTKTPELISVSMLNECTYALENVSLNGRDTAATFTNRGILYLALEKPVDALADFEQALKIRPDFAEIYVNRGNAFFMMGNVNMALEDYHQAAEIGLSQMHVVYLNLGIAYEKALNPAMAEKSYQQALSLAPEWPLAINKLQALQAKNNQSEQ